MSDNAKISKEVLQRLVPKNISITDDVVNTINNVIENEEEARYFRENIITYIGILKDPKVNGISFKTYLNAVKFVTYKMLGDSNIDAYIKVFPDRYERMVKQGKSNKYIHAIVSTYANGTTVMKIIERTIIPPSVSHRDLFYRTIEHLSELAFNANSEAVQEKACKTLIETLKPNEESKIEIDMNIKESEDIVKRYDQALEFASQKMLNMMKQGGDVHKIANIKLSKKEEIEDAEIDE
jgi:hypothetical protein